jgi:hypothetical protein
VTPAFVPAFLFWGVAMTKKIEIAPSVVADGKRLYETTDTPTRVIAATMDISRGCLNDRIAEWGWQRRRHTKALPAPAANEAEIAQQPALPPALEPPLPFAERLRRVIDAEMQVAERTLKVLGPGSSAEAERTARILATVSRTVHEIKATAEGRVSTNEADDDPVPVDIDEFRFALAGRIEAFVASERAAAVGQVSGDAGDAAVE